MAKEYFDVVAELKAIREHQACMAKKLDANTLQLEELIKFQKLAGDDFHDETIEICKRNEFVESAMAVKAAAAKQISGVLWKIFAIAVGIGAVGALSALLGDLPFVEKLQRVFL